MYIVKRKRVRKRKGKKETKKISKYFHKEIPFNIVLF